jgi:adenylate cyclase class IV
VDNTIIEIKATCASVEETRRRLENAGAVLHGIDNQVDTYFFVSSGRLKLRQGLIENNLIHYGRENVAGPKLSQVTRCPTRATAAELRAVLSAALGVDTVVDKQREIYFHGNVKLHLDVVEGLGSFVEIEAIGEDGVPPIAELRRQCEDWMTILEINARDLCDRSYSDMVRARQ